MNGERELRQAKKKTITNEYRQKFNIIITMFAFVTLNSTIFLVQPVWCAQSYTETLVQNIDETHDGVKVKEESLKTGIIIPDKVVSLDNYLTGQQTSNIYLGEYEQDNNSGNLEGISWRVLENKNGILLLLSDKNIDAIQYNEKYETISWWDSSLRNWLNGSFYKNVFSDAERILIKQAKLANDSNITYGTNGGFDTDDKVFLLSITDVYNSTYGFTDESSRMVINSPYAGARGATGKELGDGFWWLRSPGRTGKDALVVYFDGYTTDYGYRIDFPTIGLRPAFYFDTTNIIMLTNEETKKSNEVGSELFEITARGAEKNWNSSFEYDTISYIPTIWNEQMQFSVNEIEDVVLETDYTENESDLTYDYMADTEFKSVNTYISAVLQDEESHQTLFYGKLKSISEEQDARGTVTVTLPEQMREGNYVLRLFLENCNANKKADYASDFVTIPVTVGTMKKTVSVESFAANERISDEDKLLFCEGQSSQHLVVSVFLILFIVAGIFACILWMYNKRKNKVSRFKKL